MKKLLTIIGARPQIIKAAALSHAIREHFQDQIEERILHTGQHYDTNMSQVFFDELGIPAPDYNLGVGSGSHGRQTAAMIEGIEKVLTQDSFDGIVLYGDTNSTLAGAVAASKLHIPIYHIEAGLRSYNMDMPEEINRMVCDQLSTILFAPTQTAVDNLRKEGFETIHPTFPDGSTRKICLSGDVMYDNALRFASIAEQKTDILQRHNLQPGNFILATIHRPSNTDNTDNLNSIFRALLKISNPEPITPNPEPRTPNPEPLTPNHQSLITNHQSPTIVLPLHPRTANLLKTNLETSLYHQITTSPNIKIIPPVSFLEILMLEKHARLVLTDSGGVQKESFFFETPTVILRTETEWVEITNHGAGILTGPDYEKIINASSNLTNHQIHFPPLFGNGHAAETICSEILK